MSDYILLAVNDRRSYLGDGPDYAWICYVCDSEDQKEAILEEGLPLPDTFDEDGQPVYSLFGIREPTEDEVEEALDEEEYLYSIDSIL